MADNPFEKYIDAPQDPEARPGFARPEVGTATPADANPFLKYVSKPSRLESGVRGAVQGITFGLSDEGYGAYRGAKNWVTGGGSFTEGYTSGRDEERAANEAAHKENPGTYLAGELGSALVVPGGLAKMGIKSGVDAANLGLKARTVAAAKEGAAYGGLYGFGKGEGAEGSLISSAEGAAGGAALGSVLPATVDVATGLTRRILTPLRAVTNPEAVGNEKVAEAVMRDMYPGQQNRLAAGPRQLLERADDRLARVRETNPEAMLADVAGENTRNLLRSAANMPSTAAEQLRKRLDARQAGQWLRIERGLSETLANPSEYASSIDSIVANRAATSKPLFDAAMAVQIKPDAKLAEVLQRPGMQDILKRVVNKMADEGKSSTDALPMELLHRAKMEIDKTINSVKRGTENTTNWDVRTLSTLKRDLVDAIPNPTYKEALKAYSGESALKGAAEDGFETALKLPTEEIGKTLAGLGSDAERQMWRLGAARAIAGKVRQGNVMRDRTDALFGSPDMQKRLEAVMPDNEARRNFQRSLIIEAKMADTRKAVQGNSTTAKQLAQADEAAQAAHSTVAVANATMGHMGPAISFLSRQVQRFSGMTPASANAIVEAAMQKTGTVSARAWRDAVAKAEREPEFRAELVKRIMAGGAAGVTPDGFLGTMRNHRRPEQANEVYREPQ